jgi:hypothetical protein
LSPELTVVLITPDSAESLGRTFGCLRAQTARERIEVVLVAPSVELGIPEEWTAGLVFRIVPVGTLRSWGHGAATGIHEASAPLVVFGEDHAYADPGWAAMLIETYREDWAAACPSVRNANPGTALSWADFLIGYAPWAAPATDGQVQFLTGHNCSYRRELLLEYGERLEPLLEAETVLHWDLSSRGYRLRLQTAATISHVNFSLPTSFIRAQWMAGRLFGGIRSAAWPAWKRGIYALASPLIPWVRLSRIAGICRSRAGLPFLRALPWLVVGLGIDAAAQAIGYLAGPGSVQAKLTELEYHRERHVCEADRKAMMERG